MSGIYLTLWDDNKEFYRVLKPTTGGWPHITLAYTGKNLTVEELKDTAKKAFDRWVMKKVTLSRAYVNTFHHEKSGRYRHDVLVSIKETDIVEESRDELLRVPFADRVEKFSMNDPHVTVKISWTVEEAEKECVKVNELLPLEVIVSGVTID